MVSVFQVFGRFANTNAVEFEIEVGVAALLLDEKFYTTIFVDILIVFCTGCPQTISMNLE